jgi:hypothetical protein
MRRVTFIVAALWIGCVCIQAQQQQQPPAQQPGAAQQQPAAPTGPLAPEKYKNIQALKTLPADQLDGVMRFMAASLGLECQDCHVTAESGPWPMDKDDKRTKQTARKMIDMVNAINAANFNNRPRVTCATCHAGKEQPNPTPPLATELTPDQIAALNAPRPPAPPQPAAPPAGAQPNQQGQPGQPGRGGPPRPTETVDQVLDAYVAALGGVDAVNKVQTLVMKGTVTNRAAQTIPLTLELKAPGRLRMTIDDPKGQTIRTFDGTTGWTKTPNGAFDVNGFELQQLGRLADLGWATKMKERYQNLQAQRYVKIDGKDTIMLAGRTSPEVTEQLFFDKTSGLLLRRVITTRTAMGNLPEQIDYSEYRAVNGVKIPYQIRRASWDFVNTQKYTDIKANQPLDDARFAKGA